MIGCYNTIKCTGLLSNLLYMLLAIGIISAADLGLEMAEPNTPEHTYFVESLVLGGTICIIVIFGCYGLVCNLLSVNIIFTLFILIILGVEYLQLHNYGYSPLKRHSVSPWHQLELAWHGLSKQNDSETMQLYESSHHCCGYNNADDYKNLHLLIPASCYRYQPYNDANDTVSDRQIIYPHGCLETLTNSQQYVQQRDKVFMWSIVGLEIFILVQTIALSWLLYKLKQRQRIRRQVPPGVRREPRANHIAGSRAQLLQNV
ncbi:uncharacterized protein Dwil_GK21533 [Drosophila willistoni]|uniref:GK21533 n=1 Tax=Drosophila willistoni TaxID=7260 RepID=B4MPW7_DROWI|nr:protein late bloomer [Drosophila willistoni]EDW74156.1 uncharacterized protein Dwil_GK21533 [Drosophila willistoni]